MRILDKHCKIIENELNVSNLLVSKKKIKIGLITGISSTENLSEAYNYFKRNNVNFVLCTGDFNTDKIVSRKKSKKEFRNMQSKNKTRILIKNKIKNAKIRTFTILSDADKKYNLRKESFMNTNFHLLASPTIVINDFLNLELSNKKINKSDKYIKQTKNIDSDKSTIVINGNSDLINEKVFINTNNASINLPPLGSSNDSISSCGILSISDEKRWYEIKFIMKQIKDQSEEFKMHKLKITKDKKVLKDLAKLEQQDKQTKILRKKM